MGLLGKLKFPDVNLLTGEHHDRSDSEYETQAVFAATDELGNVARACKIMGYHRDAFYDVRRAFQTGGVAALVEQRRGSRNPHPNRIAPEVEARVLDYCLQRPPHGAARVANELRLSGVEVSPPGVKGAGGMLSCATSALREEDPGRC